MQLWELLGWGRLGAETPASPPLLPELPQPGLHKHGLAERKQGRGRLYSHCRYCQGDWQRLGHSSLSVRPFSGTSTPDCKSIIKHTFCTHRREQVPCLCKTLALHHHFQHVSLAVINLDGKDFSLSFLFQTKNSQGKKIYSKFCMQGLFHSSY